MKNMKNMKIIKTFERFELITDIQYIKENQDLNSMLSKLFTNVKVENNMVYVNGKMVFHSTSDKCVEAFVFGMIITKSLK